MLCSIFCLLNLLATVVGWIVLPIVTLKIVLGPERFQSLRHWMYAFHTEYSMKEDVRALLKTTRVELFSTLNDLKSGDPELSKKNALNILEIGVGTGQNLEFYPAGSRLVCIDPNKSFEVYFRRECERRAAHLDPDIRFVTERGESMPSVPDSSVDAVVICLVLCSVEHLDMMFAEIRRVLVPGGKFYFLEHSTHAPGTWRRAVQEVLTNSGVYPFLMDGCVLNRDPAPRLQQRGMSLHHGGGQPDQARLHTTQRPGSHESLLLWGSDQVMSTSWHRHRPCGARRSLCADQCQPSPLSAW